MTDEYVKFYEIFMNSMLFLPELVYIEIINIIAQQINHLVIM